MTDEQRVYIRGVKGRGSEVIKMLEERGGSNNYYLDGEDPDNIYFITHDGHIFTRYSYTEMGKIIMDYYKEIKLPEQWKDGDILATDEGEFCVLKGTAGPSTPYFDAYLAYTGTEAHKWHLATEEEVAKFHEYLHDKEGKEWDAEKRQLVDWKWKPKKGERYWFIGYYGVIRSYVWNNDIADINFLDFGNYFETKEEAEKMAEKVKKLLKEGQL